MLLGVVVGLQFDLVFDKSANLRKNDNQQSKAPQMKETSNLSFSGQDCQRLSFRPGAAVQAVADAPAILSEKVNTTAKEHKSDTTTSLQRRASGQWRQQRKRRRQMASLRKGVAYPIVPIYVFGADDNLAAYSAKRQFNTLDGSGLVADKSNKRLHKPD
eukprot:scaffold23145_cov67-Cyclotella_meneghiniana.AAC.2